MSELEMPTVITAISNSQSEGFVAGTLFTQGWSVVFRAIDFDTLERYVKDNPEICKGALLIYGTDLPGISKSQVDALESKTRQVIGFVTTTVVVDEFIHLQQIPSDAADLVSLVRGFIRTPMLRGHNRGQKIIRRAKVIAFGSAGSYTGCSTISINTAMELSNLDKSVLLVEANFRSPSIAALLAMRNVGQSQSWRNIAPNLSLAEITQEQSGGIAEFMEKAAEEFDFVIVDIGSISGLSNRLTDRRWTSTMTTWCCDQADELIVISRADYLGSHRLHQVIQLLQQTSIRSGLSFIVNMKSPGKRGDIEQSRFDALVEQIKAVRTFAISKDPRAIASAEDERATLVETNERSAMRKSIANLANQIQR